MRYLLLSLLLVSTTVFAQPSATLTVGGCGEVTTIATHGGSTTRYTLARPPAGSAENEPIALVLLVGGGGHMDLDSEGCPRALKDVSLLRQLRYFQDAGLITVLVDAPSDYAGEDGLAGFRTAAEHAQDIGKVIADVRTRTAASVWVAGTSPAVFGASDSRRNHPRFQGENFAHNMRLVDAVRGIASTCGVTPAQVALAWLLRQGDDIAPIPGTRHVEYLEENAAAVELRLPESAWMELDRAVASFQVAGLRYPEAPMRATDTTR